MDISIIIPALNERGKIASDIKAAAEFCINNELAAEIIVVDDGSTDGTAATAEKTRSTLPPSVSLRLIRHQRRLGKGYAVRSGITRSTGRYVMFADSGRCVPYGEAVKGLTMLREGLCEIAHGSRKMDQSRIVRGQGRYRRICGGIFRWFVAFYLKVPRRLTDTQCGFKIYEGDIGRKLYADCTSLGFAFDIEIILRAVRAGYRIREFPIEWTCDRDSRLRPARSLWNVLSELLRIKRIAPKSQ